jgi:hypothetical protein
MFDLKKWRDNSHLMEQCNNKFMVTMTTMGHISISQLVPTRSLVTNRPHTSDIVLANYYFFRLLSNSLNDLPFDKVITIKDPLSDFFSP